VNRARLALVAVVLAASAGGGLGLMATLATGGTEEGAALAHTHGQANWSPGERRAPAVALRDHEGKRVSLAELRRRPVLLTFLDSECVQQCPVEGRQLGIILRQMQPEDRPTVVVVSVNPRGDTPASIRHAMASWRLAGPWRWHWLRGTKAELSRVWADYGITVAPTSNDITHGMSLYLIDRRGFERAGYLFPFLPNFVALDLRDLAREQGA
jgi:cytochrome oxidase Cu insertion factor (SCO1/SenC/PrrC family)